MSVAIKKIEGVESVTASLNRGLTTIRLRPGNSVSLERLRQSIEENGFTPKEAKVTARGEIISTAGKLRFKLMGVNQTYDLLLSPQVESISEEIKKQAGTIFLFEGLIPAVKDKKAAPVFQLRSYRPAT